MTEQKIVNIASTEFDGSKTEPEVKPNPEI